MKKLLRSFTIIMMVVLMLTSVGSISLASAVGDVQTLSVQSASANGISLKWSKVSKASGYRIYRYVLSEKKWKALKTTKSVSYIDSSVNSGEVYYYRVKAYEKVNGKAVFSKKYSKTAKVVIAPDKVTGLSATKINDTSVTLKWNQSKGATGYIIYFYDTAAKKYVRLGKTANNSIIVASLQKGTTYQFAVKAYKKSGSTKYAPLSTRLSVQTKIDTVKNLNISSNTGAGFTLSWDAVSGITGYQVSVYNEGINQWSILATTTGNSYTVNATASSTAKKYRVRTYLVRNGVYYYGDYSNTVQAGSLPGTPQNLEGAVNSDNGISLRWSPVSGANGYEVYVYHAENGTWTVQGSTTKSKFNIKNLEKTDTYRYSVASYVLVSGQKVYSERCESVSIFFKTEKKPDNIYTDRMNEKGIFGYLYDINEKCFYTSDDPWQRVVGYNSVFDVAAPMSLIGFDTMRLRFEYDEKDWMIQLWKGQYGLIFYGAEVGVYTKPKDRNLKHYNSASDSEMLKMSMSFYEKKTTLGQQKWVKVFSRPYGSYWWCTGFVPGSRYGQYSNMKLEMRITMKDYDMLSGVTQALKANGVAYTVQGLDVYFTYA